MTKTLLALTLLFGACATAPRTCVTPEAYFGKYDHVIQCEEYLTRDTKDRITMCYMEDASGTVYRKRLATRSCWSR